MVIAPSVDLTCGLAVDRGPVLRAAQTAAAGFERASVGGVRHAIQCGRAALQFWVNSRPGVREGDAAKAFGTDGGRRVLSQATGLGAGATWSLDAKVSCAIKRVRSLPLSDLSPRLLTDGDIVQVARVFVATRDAWIPISWLDDAAVRVCVADLFVQPNGRRRRSLRLCFTGGLVIRVIRSRCVRFSRVVRHCPLPATGEHED